MSIQTQTNRIKKNISDSYAAVLQKGADLSSLGARVSDNLPSAILSIPVSQGGTTPTPGGPTWTRPSDRPVKPVMVDNTILMLFGVGEKSPNDIAFLVVTSPTTGYTVDWGDGEVTEYASNTKAEHIYDFESITAPVDGQGYKMVWITIRPASSDAAITRLNTQQKPSLRPAVNSAVFVPQVFEMYIQCPSLTTLDFPGTGNSANTAKYLHMDIFSLDVNSIATSSYLLCQCINLKIIEKLYMDKMTSVTYFMYNCQSYNNIFPAESTFKAATAYFMYGCTSYNQSFRDEETFEKITTNFLYNCSLYNKPLPACATFENATIYFMYGCTSYNQPMPPSMLYVNVNDQFMSGCQSFNQTLSIDLAGRTTAIGGTSFIGPSCYALKGLRLLNMGVIHTALTISNSSLDVDALVALFGDLCDRTDTTTGTITITGCYGTARLTPEQQLIATSKNWTIAA